MATRIINEPSFEVMDPGMMAGILVCGIQEMQPASQAIWYLMRGYRVFDADTMKPLEAHPHGEGEDTKLVLVSVTYPPGYKTRTQAPAYTLPPFDPGMRIGAYTRQIREVDYTANRLREDGEDVRVRKWKLHPNANEDSPDKPLWIETAKPESLEPAEMFCRDYLANLPAAQQAIATNKPLSGPVERTMNSQIHDDTLLKLIKSSENKEQLVKGRSMSMSALPNLLASP